MFTMIPVGFSNYVNADDIVAISTYKSAPIIRAVKEKMEQGNVIDLTNGKKTKAVIFMGNGTVILSSLATSTVSGRTNSANGK